MYTLIFLEILLVVALSKIFLLKRTVTRLLKENVNLYERIYQLRNAEKEEALRSDEPYWSEIDPAAFVDELNERSATLLN